MSHLEEIVKVVIYKSREIGNPVTETLAAFIAKLSSNQKLTNSFQKRKSMKKISKLSLILPFKNSPISTLLP